ncbi:YaaA family protein [Nesterenkonia alba]|uniref:YaaA family protein n=1 Tax=Nesterenkonia alba TaxID=515814 RepID=UPI0003F4EDDF|nr:peroxide stress protein YaaA [Nesterenkonia alba]
MKILLPPSEGKTTPDDAGTPLDLESLTLPELTDARRTALDAVIAASARADAQQIFKVGSRAMAEVHANRDMPSAPTAPAWQVYTGVLYEALAARSLPQATMRRAADDVLIFSGLFGVTGFTDPIPAYRCAMDITLPQLGRLSTFWKQHLAAPLDQTLAGELLVDCRSGSYQKPFPGDPQRVLQVNNFTEKNGQRKVVTHFAKAARGELAGMLLRAEPAPETIDDVVDVACTRWLVELRPAQGRKPHQLDLIASG